MVLKLHGGQKKCSEPLEIEFSLFFCEFLSEELKSFIGKVRQSVKNCLNQNFLYELFQKMVLKLP